jgi:hypothetical protein
MIKPGQTVQFLSRNGKHLHTGIVVERIPGCTRWCVESHAVYTYADDTLDSAEVFGAPRYQCPDQKHLTIVGN